MLFPKEKENVLFEVDNPEKNLRKLLIYAL